MRLVCPHCGKAHIVREEALLPSGRNVRCSACKSMWFANVAGQYVSKKSTALAAGARDMKTLVEQTQRAAMTPKSFKKKPAAAKERRFSMDPGAMIFGALLMTLASGVVFRESVVQSFPSLARIYAAAGMEINIRGFEFSGITTVRERSENGQILVVSGKIANISGKDAPIPPIKIVLRSPTGTEIHVAKAEAEARKLTADGETSFKTVLANPPEDAKDVLVRFTGTAPSGS